MAMREITPYQGMIKRDSHIGLLTEDRSFIPGLRVGALCLSMGS